MDITKYNIISILERDGRVKQDTGDVLYSRLIGQSFVPLFDLTIGRSLVAVKDDDMDYLLRTSAIEEYSTELNMLKVVTRNTVYYFEVIEEEIKMEDIE